MLRVCPRPLATFCLEGWSGKRGDGIGSRCPKEGGRLVVETNECIVADCFSQTPMTQEAREHHFVDLLEIFAVLIIFPSNTHYNPDAPALPDVHTQAFRSCPFPKAQVCVLAVTSEGRGIPGGRGHRGQASAFYSWSQIPQTSQRRWPCSAVRPIPSGPERPSLPRRCLKLCQGAQ